MSQKFCNILVTWCTIQQLWMFWPMAWMWQTTLNCEMLISPDTLRVPLTRFAEVVNVTSHSGLWNAELAWYSPCATHQTCWGCECDKPLWTVRCWAHLILSEYYSPDLPRLWKWQTTLDCEMLSSPDTLSVLFARFVSYGLEHKLRIHSFWPTWPSRFLWPEQNLWNDLVIVL